MSINPVLSIAHGLQDGGCEFVTNHPGFYSHDIFSAMGGKHSALNERVALEMAWGACLAGRRSAAILKNTGLNVALDPFLHTLLAGVEGGFVVVVTDDVLAASSPEQQDSRPLRDLFGGLWLEPRDLNHAYTLAFNAFTWSEKLDTPVVIRLTNRYFALEGSYRRRRPIPRIRSSHFARKKYIGSWPSRQPGLVRRNTAIENFVDNQFENPAPRRSVSQEAIITFGPTAINRRDAQYALKLWTYPIPRQAVKKFSLDKKNIRVAEVGGPYGRQLVREAVSGLGGTVVRGMEHKDSAPTRWRVWSHLEKFFTALQTIKPTWVVSDEGQFTDETTKSIDVCLCMGASVGVTMGLASAGESYPWCVVGDTSFAHTAMHHLRQAQALGLSFGMVVLDNGGAQSTGGQPTAINIYDLPVQIPKYIVDLEASSSVALSALIKKMRRKNKLAVLFVKVPKT